jgi:uncharacterized repeat protein (TIGR02059 family)
MCSLREAIQAVNTLTPVDSCQYTAGVDVIELPAGQYDLLLTGISEDSNASGDLDITRDLKITGFGTKASNTIINAASVNERIFHCMAGTVTIQNLKLTNGNQGGNGGAIYASGLNSLNLTDLEIINNNATGSGTGGGVQIDGTQSATIDMCTISGNNAGGFGGGLYFLDSGTTLNIKNSTFSSNNSQNGGGLYYQSMTGTGTINNCTFTMNTGMIGAAAIFNDSTTLSIKNSIVDGSCGFGFGSSSPDLINNLESGTSCNFTVAGNLQNTDPLLEAIADNGGRTITHKLLSGSPAIDTADTATCLPVDQRDESRDLMCDIGSYEVSSAYTSPPTLEFATVNGTTLILDYDEDLNTSSVPDIMNDYSVIETVNSMDVGLPISSISVSGDKVTLTLSIAANDASTSMVKISYTPGSNPIKDVANTPADALSNQSVTNNTDATAPTIQSATGNSSTITIAFNEALNNSSMIIIGDFTANESSNALAISSVSISGSNLLVMLGTPLTQGTTVDVSYAITTSDIKDNAGNTVAGFMNQAVTNSTDSTAPVLMTAEINGMTLELTYNETLDSGFAPTINDLGVEVNSSMVSLNSVGVSGTKVTVTLTNAVVMTDIVSISYPPGVNKIKDLAGNNAASLTGQSVTNNTSDTTAPSLEGSTIDGNTLILDYDENLDTNSIPAMADFSISVGILSVTVNNVSISNDKITLTLDTAAVNGDTVSLDSYFVGTNPIKDTAGNIASDLANVSVVNNTSAAAVDATPPTLTSSSINATSISLNYDEALNSSITPSNADFLVQVNGSTKSISSITISNQKVTVTLSNAVNPGDNVILNYTIPVSNAIQDSAGNNAAGISNRTITNNTPSEGGGSIPTNSDSTPPTIENITIDKSTLTLDYSENISSSPRPDFHDFYITANGKTIEGLAVTVNNDIVTVELKDSVSFGDAVLFIYKGSVGGVKDLAGNKAGNITDKVVTNNTPDPTPPILESAEIIIDLLTLDYSKKLLAKSGIDLKDFKVLVNGFESEIFSILVNEDKLLIRLSKAVSDSDKITLSYTAGNLFIEDSLGNDIKNFTGLNVANNTPDRTSPVLSSANVNKDILNLVFSKTLDDKSIPTRESFTIQSNNTSLNITDVMIDKNTIILKINPEVKENEKVTISFKSSSSSQIKDLISNAAKDFSNQEVQNNTKADITKDPTVDPEDGETVSSSGSTQVAVEEDLITTRLKVIDNSVNFYDVPKAILETFNTNTNDINNYIFGGSTLSFEVRDPLIIKRIDSLSTNSKIKIKVPNTSNKLSVVDGTVINISNNQRVIKVSKLPMNIIEGKSIIVLGAGNINIGKINVFAVNNIRKAQTNSIKDLAPQIKGTSVVVTGNVIRLIIKGNNFYSSGTPIPLNIDSALVSSRLTDVSVLPGKRMQNTVKISNDQKVIVLRMNPDFNAKNGNYLVNVFTPFGQATEVVYLRKVKQRVNLATK